MPTGYTAMLTEEKEIEFSEFAMGCARAFGALIAMRDEPMSAEIPEEFEASDYNQKKWAEAAERLETFKTLTSADYEEQAKKKYEARVENYHKRLAENERIKTRYANMLEKVREWEVPTSEHEGLKSFMIKQIQDSIKWDICVPEEPKMMTGAMWAEEEMTDILRDLKYHREQHEEEVKRTEARNLWVKQLRNSLKQRGTTPSADPNGI